MSVFTEPALSGLRMADLEALTPEREWGERERGARHDCESQTLPPFAGQEWWQSESVARMRRQRDRGRKR